MSNTWLACSKLTIRMKLDSQTLWQLFSCSISWIVKGDDKISRSSILATFFKTSWTITGSGCNYFIYLPPMPDLTVASVSFSTATCGWEATLDLRITSNSLYKKHSVCPLPLYLFLSLAYRFNDVWVSQYSWCWINLTNSPVALCQVLRLHPTLLLCEAEALCSNLLMYDYISCLHHPTGLDVLFSPDEQEPSLLHSN